jgi:hypothetical protein
VLVTLALELASIDNLDFFGLPEALCDRGNIFGTFAGATVGCLLDFEVWSSGIDSLGGTGMLGGRVG